MRTIGAIFRTREDALSALEALGRLALRTSRLGLLTPGRDRASLGEAAIAGTIPGIGPAVALGELQALLAVTTAEADELDVDACHEAVRRGCSVVMVRVLDDEEGSARDSLLSVGQSIEDARRRWEEEAQAYALAREILRPSLY
jgi:hypothetical protein